MRTRQAKKILKDYLFSLGWIRWPMPTLIAAMRVARLRKWTVAHGHVRWKKSKRQRAIAL